MKEMSEPMESLQLSKNVHGSSGKLLHVANRLAPWAVDGILNRTIDKARRERGL